MPRPEASADQPQRARPRNILTMNPRNCILRSRWSIVHLAEFIKLARKCFDLNSEMWYRSSSQFDLSGVAIRQLQQHTIHNSNFTRKFASALRSSYDEGPFHLLTSIYDTRNDRSCCCCWKNLPIEHMASKVLTAKVALLSCCSEKVILVFRKKLSKSPDTF